MRLLLLSLAFIASASMVEAQEVRLSSAVVAEAPADRRHPAELRQVRYPTGGVEVPARYFVAAGAGPHPTVLLLHGFPGTELNLDLARAMQRAGWNVMAIHYRGVWGSPGQFSFSHTIEDTRAALAWLRAPERQAEVDTARIVVLGHSMGGFDAIMVGDEAGIAGFVTISAWDVNADAAKWATPEGRAAAQAEFAGDLSLTNMTFTAMVDETVAQAEAWNWERNAAEMAGRPVLVIDSDDGGAPRGAAVVAAVTAAGGPPPTRLKFATDHSYNDHRLVLASAVVEWLQATFR